MKYDEKYKLVQQSRQLIESKQECVGFSKPLISLYKALDECLFITDETSGDVCQSITKSIVDAIYALIYI